ncbi:MAG: polysaccharide deacetylase family protein [Acidobacteriota bacterium]|nr:polysaccharide deacetylase family protein [Acidobacteriota bacterium]
MNRRKLFFTRAIKSLASAAKKSGVFSSSAPAGAVNIIAYHRVVADLAKAEREAFYGIVVSGETLRRHCELLKANYEIVSLEHAADILKNGETTQKPLAVLTFDDGYLDFYEVAFPILRELGLSATNFLPTGLIGSEKFLAHDRIFWLLQLAEKKGISIFAALDSAGVKDAADIAGNYNSEVVCDALVHLPHELREKVIVKMESLIGQDSIEYPREYELLTWQQINEMQDAGLDFGFHTANHVVLPLESDAAFEEEIFAGKRELEKRLRRKVVALAYPNGAYDDRIKSVIAKAGFEIAVTTERKINLCGKSDLLALGRFSLCEESTRGIRGVYSPAVAGLRLNI